MEPHKPLPGDLQRLCQQRPSVLQREHWAWKQRAGKEKGPALASCASSHRNSSSKNTETRLLFGPVSRGLGLKPGQGAAARSGPFSVSVSRTATCTAGSLLPTASAKEGPQELSAAQMDSKNIKLQKLQVCRGPRPLRGRE